MTRRKKTHPGAHTEPQAPTNPPTVGMPVATGPHDPANHETIEMPEATVWPMVLGLGITLLAAGVALNLTLSMVGAAFFAIGLGGWIWHLLPGRGHVHEPLAEPALRPRSVTGTMGTVEQLRTGMPGYRLRLPEKVHPISAGVKGGILGGLVMPVPALLYGILSGHGIWFPINLLAGMVLPNIDAMTVDQLQQFNLTLFIVAVFIHAVVSVSIGLIYGVLLPTMPTAPGGPLVFGGLLLPLLWTGASYGLLGILNPALRQYVEWPWFIVSQLVYGVTAALVVSRSERVRIPPAGQGPEPAVVLGTNQGEGRS